MKNLLSIALLSLCAYAQTPLEKVTLPSMIFGGASYNQYTGWTGVLSAIVPESQGVGLYGSATADVTPVKYVDPVTKRAGYVLSASFRAGQHKVVYSGARSLILLGGDFGASFASTGTPASVSIGTTGSFTATFVYRLNTHWAIGVPVRMLYVSGIGPNGSGALNPVVEPGIIWTPK